MKERNASYQIKQHIKSLPERSVFNSSVFRGYASSDNVRKVLSRLVQNREIKRIGRGVFAKGYHGESNQLILSTEEILNNLAKMTGEVVTVHGAEAARLLQLTTQMQMKPIYYTTGRARRLELGNKTIILKHISPKKLVSTDNLENLVILALLYLGKKNVKTETIKKICNRIGQKQLEKLFNYVEFMPAWLADIMRDYRNKEENLQRVEE